MRPGYVGTSLNLQIVLNAQINPYFNQAAQKNTCQIFLAKKLTESEILNLQKILQSSPSLEIRRTPLGYKM